MALARSLTLTTIAAALLVPSAGSAQRTGELTFYSEIAFRGQSYTVTGPRENARVPFTVRSARLAPGEAWQVCPQTRYRGNCNTVTEDQGNVAWTVNSARPIAAAVTRPTPVAPGNPQSLRGMASEYFPQPSDGAGRVLSCASGNARCATAAADAFCETRGWTRSAYNRQETVSGRLYLSDVLCVRTR